MMEKLDPKARLDPRATKDLLDLRDRLVPKEILGLLVLEAQMDLRERRDHVDRLDLMDPKGQRDSKDPRDLLDHLVIQLRDSSIEERKILTISRTLKSNSCMLSSLPWKRILRKCYHPSLFAPVLTFILKTPLLPVAPTPLILTLAYPWMLSRATVTLVELLL